MSAITTYYWGPEAFEGKKEFAPITDAIKNSRKSFHEFTYRGHEFGIKEGALEITVHSPLTPLPKVLEGISPTRASLYDHIVQRPYHPPQGDTWLYHIEGAEAELESARMNDGSTECRLRIEGTDVEAVWGLFRDILSGKVEPTEKWGIGGSEWERTQERLAHYEGLAKGLQARAEEQEGELSHYREVAKRLQATIDEKNKEIKQLREALSEATKPR